MNEIKEVHGTGIPVPGNDLDTDRIIPARFMKCVTFDDLGRYAFYDARFNEDGSPKDHPFNEAKYKGASILAANKNFGCGSSREHAPQALMRFGIKAIIAESFAEIFAGNCIANGVPVMTADQADIANLMQVIQDDPACEIQIDIEQQKLSYGDFSISVFLQDSHRRSLVGGFWNTMLEMLANEKLTDATRARVPYLNF